MGTRMKTMLSYYAKLAGGTWEDGQPLTPEKAETAKKELLIQIGFFQHERLIHLIVLVLSLLFLVLLIPYIRHYYLLENGVQKLYEYYDAL